MNERFVGLDVGGTAIKVGAVAPNGEVLFRDSEPLGENWTTESATQLMVDLAKRAGVATKLGVGIAGLVDHNAGRIDASPNLEPLVGISLRAKLAQELGIAEDFVAIENDANTAALGEARLGAARTASNALVVTLGTGIGGGIVVGGSLYRGAGLAGEIGHVVLDPSGPPCGCGSRGCAETYASGRSAERRAREAGLPHEEPGNLPLLCEQARAGDAAANELLQAIGHDLGLALGTALTLLDLRTFVIGGGFSAALDVLMPGIQRGIKARAFGDRVDSVSVLPAELGPDAGWIGAAYLAQS